jgi:hypothetical protein
MMLKSPPMHKGNFSLSHACTALPRSCRGARHPSRTVRSAFAVRHRHHQINIARVECLHQAEPSKTTKGRHGRPATKLHGEQIGTTRGRIGRLPVAAMDLLSSTQAQP